MSESVCAHTAHVFLAHICSLFSCSATRQDSPGPSNPRCRGCQGTGDRRDDKKEGFFFAEPRSARRRPPGGSAVRPRAAAAPLATGTGTLRRARLRRHVVAAPSPAASPCLSLNIPAVRRFFWSLFFCCLVHSKQKCPVPSSERAFYVFRAAAGLLSSP